jgi:hypothetical protein
LSEKTLYYFRMILRKHGWDRVPLGGELKQREVIIILP